MIYIFGIRATRIGSFDIKNSKCEFCETGDTQRITVFGRYTHIFWIPIFPVGKKAVAECTYCKRTIGQKDFSPELRNLYKQNKSKVKRPFWHWLGLGVIGFLIVLISIIGLNGETDPRYKLLDKDEELMQENPTMETDSISYKIKQVFDENVADELNPEDFKYYSKVSGNKLLVLIQIPKLKKIKKEDRIEVLNMIEMIINSDQNLKEKEKYIGVKGRFTYLLIKTPDYTGNSIVAYSDKLYDFYGAMPVEKK